jgi:hypothetical protein
MNPFAAIWYRFINDPLQIYLTAVCFWMILSGRMPTTRKIWTQVPRSGVIVGGAVTRKVGVDAVQVPETDAVQPPEGDVVPQAVEAAENGRVPEEVPKLPKRVPVSEAARRTEPIRISEATALPAGGVGLLESPVLPGPKAAAEPAAVSGEAWQSGQERLPEESPPDTGLSHNGPSENGSREDGLPDNGPSENGSQEDGLPDNGLSGADVPEETQSLENHT